MVLVSCFDNAREARREEREKRFETSLETRKDESIETREESIEEIDETRIEWDRRVPKSQIHIAIAVR